MEFKELTLFDKTAYLNYKNSWQEKMVPTSSSMNLPYTDFIQKLNDEKINKSGTFVPAKTLFLFDNKKIIGSVQIRYSLNKNLMMEGGHIGYGVSPDYRGLGYGTKLLQYALKDLKKHGATDKALLTCNRSNVASSSIIRKCNGVLESRYKLNNIDKESYLIQIKK